MANVKVYFSSSNGKVEFIDIVTAVSFDDALEVAKKLYPDNKIIRMDCNGKTWTPETVKKIPRVKMNTARSKIKPPVVKKEEIPAIKETERPASSYKHLTKQLNPAKVSKYRGKKSK